MTLETPPAARVEMLFRVPVARVFEAFVDPSITTKFWFTRSDGRLEPGKTLRWYWDMFNVSGPVTVLAVEPNERIRIEWGEAPRASIVEWTFVARPDGTTVVRVANTGFSGTDDEIVAQALDSTGGFAWVLANAKALLEHGISLNLILDSHPG